MDRPAYRDKMEPLSAPVDKTVFEAVSEKSERDCVSAIIVDDAQKVIVFLAKRDLLNKLVGKGLDSNTMRPGDIRTPDTRLARETDDLVDRLRLMSNERFHRLPVVDAEDRIKAVFTQGGFVSYTWPDLPYQMTSIGSATVFTNWLIVLIGAGGALHPLLMVLVINQVT
ncbi:MAG: CBS domain-containing protein [Sulfitobacter sp.]|nr:CBS domain-containing protein [Sulfitobacter sp.]